jgi:hypothetical protein
MNRTMRRKMQMKRRMTMVTMMAVLSDVEDADGDEVDVLMPA